MSLDWTLRFTFRHFATLFLLVALFTVPLHVGRAFAYRRVVGLRELHPAIAELPPDRFVRGVGAADLESAQGALLAVIVLELALIPLLAGAVRRVAQSDAAGRLPRVFNSLGHSLAAWRHPAPNTARTTLAAGAVLAFAVGTLVYRTGLLLAEPVPESVAFAPIGLAEALAAAAAAPFFLVPLALLPRSAKGKDPGGPTLY
ncbi:MAG TPA: hypothetical protein VFA00_12555 [Actinomycetota bacterium]|nr:hypothetical protein [Actinomycetota bacterium]